MEFNNILIASDFSKHADYALQRAISIAEQHQSALCFVHVLIQPWIGNWAQIPIVELEQANRARKKQTETKLLERLKKYSHALETHASVLNGRAADEIIRHAKENDCKLIVAGAHGQYHINDYVLGTTSSSIVRHSPVPILLVKREPTFAYKRILIATDFSDVSKDAIEFTFSCFPRATFQLLHIIDIHNRGFFTGGTDEYLGSKPDEKKGVIQNLDDFLETCNVDKTRFEKKTMGGYFADLIVAQSEKWNADLISFGTQGNSRLHYLLIGSVAQRLLQLSTTDMIAVPPRQK